MYLEVLYAIACRYTLNESTKHEDEMHILVSSYLTLHHYIPVLGLVIILSHLS